MTCSGKKVPDPLTCCPTDLLTVLDAPPLLAEVVRNGVVESRHRGSVAALAADGSLALALGDVDAPVFPRSSLKPLQAVAMLRAGWKPQSAEQLALVAASHDGTPRHVAAVDTLLASAGLGRSSLQCPSDLPLDPAAAADLLRSGGAPEPVRMNCSGKHAGMLATCVTNGWPTGDYLTPSSAVQRAIHAAVEDLAGEAVGATAVDGCGAPLLAVSLVGLARAVQRLVMGPPGSPEWRVADAMRAHPDVVGGDARDVTRLMRAVPGLLAKDGADGVYVAATAAGAAVALKIEDGAARARMPVLAAALERVGVPGEQLRDVASVPVLGGGVPVGEVRWSGSGVPGGAVSGSAVAGRAVPGRPVA